MAKLDSFQFFEIVDAVRDYEVVGALILAVVRRGDNNSLDLAASILHRLTQRIKGVSNVFFLFAPGIGVENDQHGSVDKAGGVKLKMEPAATVSPRPHTADAYRRDSVLCEACGFFLALDNRQLYVRVGKDGPDGRQNVEMDASARRLPILHAVPRRKQSVAAKAVDAGIWESQQRLAGF